MNPLNLGMQIQGNNFQQPLEFHQNGLHSHRVHKDESDLHLMNESSGGSSSQNMIYCVKCQMHHAFPSNDIDHVRQSPQIEEVSFPQSGTSD